MKNKEKKAARKKLARIAKKTDTYLEAFKAAGRGEGRIEDLMDAKGVAALREITARDSKALAYISEKGPQDFEATKAPEGAYVPSIRDKDGTGYDLFSLLMKDRIVLLQGEVNESMSAVACASLLYLDSEHSSNPGEEIKVFINSPGGSVIDGLAIYDTMRNVDCPVTTTGIGYQASMGSVLLAGGDVRRMTENSKLMIHSIGSGTQGKQVDQEISLDSARRLFEDLKAVYVRHIGLTPEFWDLCCAKDTWFSAAQAKKMGFISEIIAGTGNKKPAPYEKSADKYLFNQAAARESKVPKAESEILARLQGTSADQGEGERIRPELLVALSQLPKYWTPELKAEKQALQQAAVANDNSKKAPARANARKKAAPGVLKNLKKVL